MKFSALLILVAFLAVSTHGQTPRAIETSKTTARALPAAPKTVNVKYEGGVLGHRKKQDGTLTFDDDNSRLLFKDKKQMELFSIPYEAISQAYSDTKSLQPKAASVISQIPVPFGLNLPAKFIKKKYRFLTLQFYDDTSQVGGLTSFKVDTQQLVDSMVSTLASKAGLVPKGDVYARERRPQFGTPAEGGSMVGMVGARPVDESVRRPAVFVENEALSGRVISLPRPVYPESAKTNGTSGVVRVLVTVDERGRIEEAEAVSGPSVFQQAAVDAAKQAIFEPILKEGKAVKMKAVISYYFQSAVASSQ